MKMQARATVAKLAGARADAANKVAVILRKKADDVQRYVDGTPLRHQKVERDVRKAVQTKTGKGGVAVARYCISLSFAQQTTRSS